MTRKLIYGILLLFIIITPFIYSATLYSGVISAKQLWFLGISALIVLVFGIDLFISKRCFSFNINLVDVSLLTFYAYLLFRLLNTLYTPLLYNTKFLNYTLLIILYFILRCILSGIHYSYKELLQRIKGTTTNSFYISLSEILIIILILSGLVQAIWGLLQLYGFTRSFHSGFKITGTFFNPAPYALYLATIFPLALGYVLTEIDKGVNKSRITKLRYYISLFTVIAIILVLPATMNRASWIGVSTGSIVVLNYRYNLFKNAKALFHNTFRKLWAFSIIVILIVISGAGLYFLKKGSSDGRLLIWEVTAGKIAEKPLFGHGVGRFESEYNNWQAEYFKAHPEEMDGTKGMVAGNTRYCFNEYLEMGSELGITGLLIFLGVMVSVFSGNRRSQSSEHRDQNVINDNLMTPQANDNSFIIIIPSLISLLLMGLISFPFYSLPTMIVFFLLLGMLSSQIRGVIVFNVFLNKLFIPKTSLTFVLFSLLLRVPTIVVFTLISVLLLLMVNKQDNAFRTWDEAVILYQSGVYVEANKKFAENYTLMKYNGGYLQYYGKSLYMNEEYMQSIVILERASLYTSDEMLFTNLGDTYKALERYPEAEASYKNAMLMVPHKLYPQYLLAKLYRDTGQKEEALLAAKDILNQEIKVESTATKEIRKEMQDLITTLTTE